VTARAWVVFLSRRLSAIAVLLLLVSFLIFALLYIAPGNPIDILLGETPRTPDVIQKLNHQYHLDQPFFTQYWIWLKNAARLHFGTSINNTLPVSVEIKTRFPTSALLGAYAFLLTMVFGLAMGLIAALKRETKVDRGIMGAAVVGLSSPAFVTAIGLLYLFSITLKWFPVYGKGAGFVDELWHLTLPAIALAVVTTAAIAKQTRAALLGVLDQDYVAFARARGLSQTRVLFRYILRNGLVPVATIATILLSALITGAVLAEAIFSIPGIGGLLVQAANNQDIPVLQGVGMLLAAMIMLANLAADVLYMLIDPRIRFAHGSR
jgi:peptide/nickel transport system permease protein